MSTMHGADVVVIERHSELSSCEGRVIRVTDRDTVPVAVVEIDGARHRLPVAHLGRMPLVGGRYRWDAGYVGRYGRTPFTVGPRFEAGHQFAGLFRLLEDCAGDAAEARGHSAIASAAELAKYAVLIQEPDGADEGIAAESVAPVCPPRNGAAALDTLRDVVLETALAWDEALTLSERGAYLSPKEMAAFPEHRAAIAAYRTARDS